MLAVFQLSIVPIHIRTAMKEKFVAIIGVFMDRAVSAVPVPMMEIVNRMSRAVVEVVGAVHPAMNILARSIQIALRINTAALDFVPGMIAIPS